MRLLQTSLPLILIGLALLLSTARNAQAITDQIPTPQTTSETKGPSSEHKTNGRYQSRPASIIAEEQASPTTTGDQYADHQKRETQELALNAALSIYTGQLARYTLCLVVVGAIGLVIATLQAMFLLASIQEHLRPKVRIRSLTMVNDLPTQMEDKAPFRFALTLVNHGGTRARIKSGNFTIRPDPFKEVPTWGYGEPAYRPPFDFLKGKIVRRGPDAFFEETADHAYSKSEIQELIDEKMYLHIVGFVWYRGRFQLRGYKTAFCRRYDVKQEKLIPSGDEETEFAD